MNKILEGWLKKAWLKEVLAVFALALFLFVFAYFSIGFRNAGISAPIAYSGGDDFWQYNNVKTVGEKAWYWETDRLGAPYSSKAYDFPNTFLMNTEMLASKIIYAFTKNPVTTANMQILLTFSLCGAAAFIALRALKINFALSLFGALLFGMAPYIQWRGVGHYCLSACYFVPFSILLCVWAFEKDENYLKISKSFFKNRRNILTIVLALLIANNGAGYYPIFTCIFLLVVAIALLLAGRRSEIYKPFIIIGLIFIFFVVALIPVFCYWLANGRNISAVIRSWPDAEMYGLKIALLFLPINGHGIPFLQKFISDYHAKMPLVNENTSEYLGIGACLGFLLSLLYMFIPQKKDSLFSARRYLFSRLNVCAILYASIGGFSSLIFILFFPMLRGFNRISIFIMFISISVLCGAMQQCWEKMRSKRHAGILLKGLLCAFCLICLCDQKPRNITPALIANQQMYNSDRNFVSKIEEMMQAGDMVFQLPCHAFPERGPVRNMQDYHLYTGYLHSSKEKGLRWSYGGVAGRESDTWNKYVSGLPPAEMMPELVSSGFRGIYIDKRAYDDASVQALMSGLEDVIETKPIESENGNLLFYNLYPYIQRNQSLLSREPLTLEAIFYAPRQIRPASLLYNEGDYSFDEDNNAILSPGTRQYGPYHFFKAGTYQVTVYGEGLGGCNFVAVSDFGKNVFSIYNMEKQDDKVTYMVDIPKDDNLVEFLTYNVTDHDVVLKYIEWQGARK